MEEDGIARTKIKPGIAVTILEAKENVDAVNCLDSSRSFPLLIDSRDIKSMTKEARDYFSINNRKTAVIAFAILVDSPLSRIIGNFFMGLNKPSVPAKIFNKKKDALKWLAKYL